MRELFDQTTSFVRLEPVHNLEEVFDLFKKQKPLLSTTPMDWAVFFYALMNHEKKHGYKYEKYHNKHAYSVEIMIPQNLTPLEQKELAQKIANSMLGEENPLPYSVFLNKKGKGIYLYFLISERYYSEDGFNIDTISTKDRYRNAITGRLCKKEDPDAVLVYKKGELISRIHSTFSKKESVFCFTEKSFLEFVNSLKEIIRNALKAIGFNFLPGVSFRKLDRRNHNKYIQRNITRVNDAARYADTKYNDAIAGLMNTKLWNERTVRNQMFALYKKINHVFAMQKFVYKDRFTIPISPKMGWDKLDNSLETLELFINEKINETMNDIYGVAEF